MKKDIHPTYYENATWTCACGATYVMGSTKETLAVEICSNCHPFYTGNEKLTDTAGRVEKFRARAGGVKAKKPKAKKTEETVEATSETPENEA